MLLALFDGTGNNTIDEKDVNDICAIIKQLLK